MAEQPVKHKGEGVPASQGPAIPREMIEQLRITLDNFRPWSHLERSHLEKVLEDQQRSPGD